MPDIQGPTGTLLDGLIDIKPGDLEGSMLGDVLAEADGDIYLAHPLGARFVKTWPVWSDEQRDERDPQNN